jgi:hypothetical protein
LEKVSYLNLPNCLRLSNGAAEVVVTTDVGPRVVRYGFVGGENILGEWSQASVPTEWGEWKPWGGHRLWTAPEAKPRSYSPDNDPVEHESAGPLTIRLIQKRDERAGVQKEMELTLDAEGSGLSLLQRVTNRGAWPVELAAWGLTIMRGGGEAVIPQEPFGPHPEFLLPARPLVLWPFTDMSDPRWTFGPKFIRLRADESSPTEQKVGVMNKQGWAAYRLGETLFVKRFGFDEHAVYPDYGCNCEVFTAGSFIEVESLSPLKRLEPGESIEHVEHWHLFDGFRAGASDDELDAAISPLVATPEHQSAKG